MVHPVGMSWSQSHGDCNEKVGNLREVRRRDDMVEWGAILACLARGGKRADEEARLNLAVAQIRGEYLVSVLRIIEEMTGWGL